MAHRNYLEVEEKPNSLFSVVEDLDLKMKDFDIDVPAPEFTGITPKPGFCVKLKTDNGEKVFINLCHCSEVPSPPPTLDVNEIMATGNNKEEALFHFPLSLGECHVELDKSGNECKCYDVVINSEYFTTVSKNSSLLVFIMTLACSGLERKYDISLDVSTSTFLKKSYHGKMPLHFIRLNSSTSSALAQVDKIIPDQDDIVMPVRDPSLLIPLPTPQISQYDLFQTPATENPSLLIFQGLTTNARDRKSFTIFVSKRRLTVRDKKGKSLLSIILPYTVIPEKSLSNFWKNRLFVTMPIMFSDL